MTDDFLKDWITIRKIQVKILRKEDDDYADKEADRIETEIECLEARDTEKPDTSVLLGDILQDKKGFLYKVGEVDGERLLILAEDGSARFYIQRSSIGETFIKKEVI